MKEYFDKYVNREEAILNYWIDSNPWIKEIIVKYEDDHTPFHDWKIIIKIKEKIVIFTVQIKEEEVYWFKRTGNLGLDFISAFNFLKQDYKKEIENNNYWVSPDIIEKFLNNKIKVMKWGKLITCDSNIHIFFVNGEFCQAYSNSKMKSDEMIKYLKSNYSLRINKKQDYGLADDWESAAFFVKPIDEKLKSCEINNIEEIKTELGVY